MEQLLELCSIITRQKIKQINTLNGQDARKNTKLTYKLYKAILEKQIQNDKEAKELLYRSNTSENKYRQLKNALKNRIINTIFFIDVKKNKYTTRVQAEITCHKDLAAINILKHFGAHKTIINLSKKIFRKADEYELTLLCVNALGALCSHYVIRENNQKEFKFYQNKLEEKTFQLYAEMTLRNDYLSIIHQYPTKKSDFDKLSQKAQEKAEKAKAILQKTNTTEAIYYGYLIRIMALEGAKHIDERIRLCKEAIAIMEKKSFIKNQNILAFRINIALLYIAKRNLKKGETYIHESLKLTNKHSFNWFKVKEVQFMLYMHTEEYDKANSIIEEVFSAKQFKNKPTYLQEIWNINQAYVFLLIETGFISNTKKQPLFKIGKFFNEVPIYSKDKRGINISILILQYIFWLNRKKLNNLIDKVESLRQYTYKHLKKTNLKRSNLFLKMLCAAADASFHPVATKRKTEKLYRELCNTPIDLSTQPFEIETIPYEKLWEITLFIINKNT